MKQQASLFSWRKEVLACIDSVRTHSCVHVFQSSLWETSLEHSNLNYSMIEYKITIQCNATKIMNVIISPTTTLPYWEQGTFPCQPTHYQWLGYNCINRKTNISSCSSSSYSSGFYAYSSSSPSLSFILSFSPLDFSSSSFLSSSCHKAITLTR